MIDVRTWWNEGHSLLPMRCAYKGEGFAELSRLGKVSNAYHHHTRWVRWSWWSYVWRAPERYGYRPPFKATRDWRDLSRWTVRWCRLRGHPGIIFYNAGGLEPDTRCRRCSEDIG